MDKDKLFEKFSSNYIFCDQICFSVRSSILSYVINILNANFKVKFREKRTILNKVGCQIEIGTLNALLGVSGSGKSTLLKSLLSKEDNGKLLKNYEGNVLINQQSRNPNSLYLAFIGQKDLFHEVFTVREVINLAFELKYKNPELRARMIDERIKLIDDLDLSDKKILKQQVVQTIIKEMNLIKSADTRIKFCSGGEKKRLSLAVELIALPDFLLLDEPTTGLDSSTSIQILNYLKKCTEIKQFTVVCVIHQPSYLLFNTFGNVIIQSKNGNNIFNGPPSKLTIYLKEHQLDCPKFFNPADFIIDVANGDFGEEVLQKLVDFQKRRHKYMLGNEIIKSNNLEKNEKHSNRNKGIVSLSQMIIKSSPFYWSHLYHLTIEATKIQMTDKLLLMLKAFNYFLNLITFHIAFGSKNGQYDGCPKYELTKSFQPSRLEEVLAFNKEQSDAIIAVTGNIYFSVFIVGYCNAALPAFIIPTELKIFLRQSNNLWYSLTAFFFSRVIADLPITIVFSVAYASLNWYVTGIVAPFERYLLLMLCYIAISIFIQALSTLFGAIFLDSPSAAVYLILLGCIPMCMMSERIKLFKDDWNLFFWIFSKVSFMAHQFKAMMFALYGYSRCGEENEKMFVNYTKEVKDWLDYYLDVKKGNETGGVTDEFSNTLLKLINGEYFNKKNLNNKFEFRSMVLNKFEMPNLSIVYPLSNIFGQTLLYRILSIILFYYLTKNRIG